MYLSVGTEPDIIFAVNKASQYLEKPNKIHWNTVKRIFNKENNKIFILNRIITLKHSTMQTLN